MTTALSSIASHFIVILGCRLAPWPHSVKFTAAVIVRPRVAG